MMAAVLLSCAREEVLPVEPEVPAEDPAGADDIYVYGEARVYLSEDMTAMVEEAAQTGSIMTKSSGMNAALAELGVTEMRRLFPYAGEFEERTRREGLHRWYVVKYSPEVALTKAQTSLEQVEGVDVFEPVRQTKINDFNDLTSDLWGLYNTSRPGFDINVKPVWRDYTVGDPDVIVCVVDNGIDISHEDLAANTLNTGHYNAVTDNSYIVAGDHGTHVAGIIAAVSNNGKGIAGVAGGDKAAGKQGVKLMSCQIFVTNSDGTTTSAGGAAAIKYGADNGAVISQNSWGYTYDADGDGQLTGEELSNALSARISGSDRAAVDYFIKYAGCDNKGNQLQGSPMKGGVVIFAAGNDAITMGAPAEYDPIIAVGSVAADGTKSSFSNFGEWVDICAPGSSILSTLPNNGYGVLSGTSMACPYVSGVAALLVSHFGGPGFTNDMLKEKILESANKSAISQANQIGGLVDAYGAFVYGNDKAPAAVTDLKVAGRGNSIDISLTIPADDEGKAAYGILALYDTDKAKLEAADKDNYSEIGYKTFIVEGLPGEQAEFVLTPLEFEKDYYLKVIAYSYGRSYSDASEVVTATTTENNPPVVTSLHEGDYTIMPSETLNISVEIVEPDGHQLTVELVSGSAAESLTQNPDGLWRLRIKGNEAEMGTYTSKIVATDEYGLAGVLEIVYTIRENLAPVKVKDIENIFMKSKGQEVVLDMTKYVSDPDAEQLKYEAVMSNQKVAHANPKGNDLIITALTYGTTDITVTAKDARGESVSLTFKVLVKDPSDPVSVYPNPVTDYVNIGTMEEAETGIKITNQTGKLVIDQTVTASAFEPARIDMTSCAPGIYTVTVTVGGNEYKEKIVKL